MYIKNEIKYFLVKGEISEPVVDGNRNQVVIIWKIGLGKCSKMVIA
jgi:hypothetical protein